MSDIRKLLESFDNMSGEDNDVILIGDQFDIELQENFVIETGVVGFMEDGIIVQGDDAMFEFLNLNGVLLESIDADLEEGKLGYTAGLIALLAALWGTEYHFAKEAYQASEQLPILLKHYERAKAEGDERMMDQLEDRIDNHKFRLSQGMGDVRGDDFEPIKVVYDKEGIAPEEPENLKEHPVMMALGRAAAAGAGSEIAGRVADKVGLEELNDLGEMKRLLSTVGKMSKDGVEINGKPVNVNSIEVDGVDTRDYPDFVDAYATYAEFEDGTPLSDQELELLQDKHGDIVYQAVQDSLFEAEYQGRKVTLNKPMKGDVAKSKVYVKNAKGNVVKVNFGDKNMKIKKSNPKRRKSFRARHNCDNPGPKWKARYWSCRAW
jgi:hypothetical protein